MTSCTSFYEKLMIFIVMDNGNSPPTRIEVSENTDRKLLSPLEWPYVQKISVNLRDGP